MARDELDRYYTPALLASACVRWLADHMGAAGPLYDPCAGGGAWLDAAHELGWASEGCDLDPSAPAVLDGRAACEPMERWTPRTGVGWWITNPPYGPVEAWISTLRERQQARGDSGLALLMRLTAIEWLIELDDPPHALVTTSQRARWEGPGGALYASGDSCGAVLAVWGRCAAQPGRPAQAWPLGQWRPTRRRGGT
jgi:hypothetical protein